MKRAGFTLLEVLVATVIMGIAVAGLIAGLSQSVRNAARLSDYDRAAMLARTKMNESCATTRPITSTETVIQISCVRSVRRHGLLSRRSATASSDAAPWSVSAS